jgi:hypothetical protein
MRGILGSDNPRPPPIVLFPVPVAAKMSPLLLVSPCRSIDDEIEDRLDVENETL